MLDHTSISVEDYAGSLNFYDKTMEILGYERVLTIDNEHAQCAGYGKDGKPSFWISPMGEKDELLGQARGLHFAFLAPTKEAVNAWYAVALELGGKDNGAPGPRPYHEGYYGAFVVDPSGWRIEACHHTFE